MKTLQQLTTLLFLLLQTITAVAQDASISTLNDKYDMLLQEKNQGIAMLIKRDNVLHQASLGNYNLNELSVFNIGSATKTFTAILILQEFEKGNLKLTDTIGTYLSPIANVDGSLTIEMLLTHESGLDEIIGKNVEEIFYAKSDSLYDQNLLATIEKNDPEKIGTFDYCNTNYYLLGKIIEKVTDQNYFDVLRQRIIDPLQMENTYPYVHKNAPNLATPIHDGTDVSAFLDYRYFANIAYAAGSIGSTLLDMEKFYTGLFETEIILKKETVTLMMESGNETYGYGLFKTIHEGQHYYGHGGNNIGYAFRNEYNPATKNLFMIFTNSMRVPLQKSIKNDVFAFLDHKPIEDFVGIDIEYFKKYVGTYLLKEANLELKIVLEDNKMYLAAESQGVKSELTRKDEHTLIDTTVGATLTVIEDDVNGLTFHQNGYTTTIHKVSSAQE